MLQCARGRRESYSTDSRSPLRTVRQQGERVEEVYKDRWDLEKDKVEDKSPCRGGGKQYLP